MKRLIQLSLAVSALALVALPASAQMTTSKSTEHPTAGMMQSMMPQCKAMMNEFMADPIVQQRMMAIMQKHMKSHAGKSMMMMPGMSGSKGMPDAATPSDSSSHATHHASEPAVTPAAPSTPMPVQSP